MSNTPDGAAHLDATALEFCFGAFAHLVSEERIRSHYAPLIRELLEHARAGWQPIETAPKDGTHLLVGSFRHTTVRVAYWSEGHDMPRWQPAYSSFGRCEPTHWMPLPKAPRS